SFPSLTNSQRIVIRNMLGQYSGAYRYEYTPHDGVYELDIYGAKDGEFKGQASLKLGADGVVRLDKSMGSALDTEAKADLPIKDVQTAFTLTPQEIQAFPKEAEKSSGTKASYSFPVVEGKLGATYGAVDTSSTWINPDGGATQLGAKTTIASGEL